MVLKHVQERNDPSFDLVKGLHTGLTMIIEFQLIFLRIKRIKGAVQKRTGSSDMKTIQLGNGEHVFSK